MTARAKTSFTWCVVAPVRWGDRLEYVAEAAPADFIYVPHFVPHQRLGGLDSDARSTDTGHRHSHRAWAATRFIQAQLFGVAPTELLTMFAAALGVVTVDALGGDLSHQVLQVHGPARFRGARQCRPNGHRLVMILEPYQERRLRRAFQPLLIQPRIIRAHVGIHQ